MTPVFAARRRAEEFNSLVEGTSTGHDPRHADLLEFVEALRATPAPEARPEFVSDLRAQLMVAARHELVAAERDTRADARLTLPVRKPLRERRLAAAVGGLAIVGATTSVAMAAQSALPGDVLYPLKRAIENAEAGISVNDAQRGSTMLANASGRLDEVTALTRDGRIEDTTAIAETLVAFTDQAITASELLLSDYESTGSESSISELRDFTAESMETLAALEGVVPADARDELLLAARVLTQIDTEAAEACPSCGGVGISEIPAILISSTGDYTGGTQQSATPQGGGDQGSGSGKAGNGSGDGAGQSTDGGTTLPGGVLNPPTGSGGSGDTEGGDGGGETTTDPITTLTENLTGGGGTSTSGGGGGGTPPADPVDEVGEVVDEVTDPLLGNN